MKSQIIAVVVAVLISNQAESAAPKKIAGQVQEREILGQVFVVTKGRDNIKLALVSVKAFSERVATEHIRIKKSLAVERVSSLSSAYDEAKQVAAVANAEKLIADGDYNNKQQAFMNLRARNTLEEFRQLKEIAAAARSISRAADKASEQAQAAANVLRAQIEHYSSPEYYFDQLPEAMMIAKTDADGRFSMRLPAAKYILAAKSDRAIISSSESYHWLVTIDSVASNQSVMLSNDNLFETKCLTCVQP